MVPFIQNRFFQLSLLAFVGVPLLLFFITDIPARSVLKDFFSILTILAYFQLIGQFFWARTNKPTVRHLTMGRVVKYHKWIGYTFVAVMLFHPLYIVIPRFFEAGVSPIDAFVTMVTTMNLGIVLGIFAWCFMLILTLTSLMRAKMPMKYNSWRALHGILAILFIVPATWHAIDLGRHSTTAMSLFLSVLTAGGILLLLKIYFIKK